MGVREREGEGEREREREGEREGERERERERERREIQSRIGTEALVTLCWSMQSAIEFLFGGFGSW